MSKSAVGHDLWCRRYRSSDDGAEQLICFPHAGGSASFYLPVSVALSPAVDVVAIQYPGRQDRRHEPLISDITLLADRIHAVLRAARDRPVTFFGHSMGAVVAFEVARRLEADGRSLVRIFASGRRAPSARRNESVHLRDDAGILAEVHSLNGTDSALLQEDEIMRAALPVLRADYRAIEKYTCAPGVAVNCPISALVGEDDPQVTPDEASAWAGHTTGAFDIHMFAGGHFYLVDRSNDVLKILRRHFSKEIGE
jgi:surfactin synthase thioesterase subunit